LANPNTNSNPNLKQRYLTLTLLTNAGYTKRQGTNYETSGTDIRAVDYSFPTCLGRPAAPDKTRISSTCVAVTPRLCKV